MTEPRGVVIACADRLFAESAAAFLDGTDGWRSAGIASDGLQALALVARTDAERVLVIGDLPRLPAATLARQLRRRSPDVGVVLLGAGDSPHAHVLPPQVGSDALLEALSSDAPVSSDVPAPAAEGLARLSRVTPRELSVLKLLTQGESREEIAARLGVSQHTVRTHMQNLYAKPDLHNRLELVKFGARHGLVGTPGEPSRNDPL